MPKAKYKAVIIGCGQIGALASLPTKSSGILTHAHAYRHEPRTQLTALADRDQAQVARAARLWGVTGYKNTALMLEKENADMVSVCVPDEAHADVLEMCLSARPKIVFCEKPLTTDFRRAKKITNAYAKAGVVLAVNFSRRWNQDIIRLRGDIRKGLYGKYLSAQAVYTKGILHNGSHMIDLLRYLLGEIVDVKALSSRVDWKKTDPSVEAFVSFPRGVGAHLSIGDERDYSVFDLQMLFTEARVSLTHFGEYLTVERVKADPAAKGYTILGAAQKKSTRSNRNILNAVKNLADVLDGRGALLSPAKEAIQTQMICESILKDYSKRSSR